MMILAAGLFFKKLPATTKKKTFLSCQGNIVDFHTHSTLICLEPIWHNFSLLDLNQAMTESKICS